MSKKKTPAEDTDQVFYKKQDIFNPFMQAVSDGPQIKVLMKAASFFKKYRGVSLLPYYLVLGRGITISPDGIDRQGMIACEICGSPLYKLETVMQTASFQEDEDLESSKRRYLNNFKDLFRLNNKTIDKLASSPHTEVSLSKGLLAPKEHLAFVDCQGRTRHTCYKLSLCIKKMTSSSIITPVDFTSLNLSDFIMLEPSSTPDQAKLHSKLKSDFNKHVLPFIKKWQFMSVNKLNVSEVIRDIEKLEGFLSNIDKGPAYHKALERILNAVGISI